jgi:nucleotide-binding universal stress UspA family protein
VDTTTIDVQQQPGVTPVNRLLVPLDGTEASAAALPVAAALAVRLGATVAVVDCLPPAFRAEDERHWVDQQLLRVGLSESGGDAVHETLAVVDDILASARQVDGTVICMASHARTSVGQLLFGSTTHDVIMASPAPVLVVGPRCEVPQDLDVVQVCVDGSRASEVVVDVAASWARMIGAAPWLTQVVDPASPGDPLVAAGDVVEGQQLARLAGRPRQTGIDVEWDVLHGRHPARALATWASAHRAGLVVAGSHGRSSVQRLRPGSVTASLAQDLTCPLLVVGPAALA